MFFYIVSPPVDVWLEPGHLVDTLFFYNGIIKPDWSISASYCFCRSTNSSYLYNSSGWKHKFTFSLADFPSFCSGFGRKPDATPQSWIQHASYLWLEEHGLVADLLLSSFSLLLYLFNSHIQSKPCFNKTKLTFNLLPLFCSHRRVHRCGCYGITIYNSYAATWRNGCCLMDLLWPLQRYRLFQLLHAKLNGEVFRKH